MTRSRAARSAYPEWRSGRATSWGTTSCIPRAAGRATTSSSGRGDGSPRRQDSRRGRPAGRPVFRDSAHVERDTQFDHLRTGEALRRGLAAKNRYNLRTIGLFLFTRWVGVFLFALLYL